MPKASALSVSIDGVLAQLGARNIRNVEATGSNPAYSMNEKCRKIEGFLVKSMVLRHFYVPFYNL